MRLVVPFAPAGPTDIIGRKAAEKITALLGQTMIVENKAGAAGSIGAVEVKNAKPDGYTLPVRAVLDARHQSDGLRPSRLRRGEGLHADLLGLRQSAGPGGASLDAGLGDRAWSS